MWESASPKPQLATRERETYYIRKRHRCLLICCGRQSNHVDAVLLITKPADIFNDGPWSEVHFWQCRACPEVCTLTGKESSGSYRRYQGAPMVKLKKVPLVYSYIIATDFVVPFSISKYIVCLFWGGPQQQPFIKWLGNLAGASCCPQRPVAHH